MGNYPPGGCKPSLTLLLLATFFATILVLSVPLVSAQSALPPTVSNDLPSTFSGVQGNPFLDPFAGGLLNQYPDSQTYPYQDPYQVPSSPTQSLPDYSLPLEEQQFLQENSIADSTTPETTISSVVDGNNVQLQEGFTTTSNKVVLTIEGADDSTVTGFQCVLDNLQQDPLICGTNPVVAENLQPGVHLFQISSVDSAGNVDATPAIFSWSIVSTSAQAFTNEIMPQLQQFPQPLQDQQQILSYQPNISPFTTVIPNPSNVTTIYENQQLSAPIPSPTLQTTNPAQVPPPHYYTTHPNQLLQSSQNISGPQQPFGTSLQSPSQAFSFSSSQLDPYQQKTIKTNDNITTNDVIGQNQNPVDLQKQLRDTQKGQIQTNTESAAGEKQDDILSSNSESKLGVKPTVIPAANATNTTSPINEAIQSSLANASMTSATNETSDNTSLSFRTANSSSHLDSVDLNSTAMEGITNASATTLGNNNNSQAAFTSTREPVSSQIQTEAVGGTFTFSDYTITDFVYNPRTGEGLPNYKGTVKACITPGSQVRDGHEYDTRASACDPSTTSPPRPFPIVEYNGVMYKNTHINPVPVVTDSTGHAEFTIHTPISTRGGIGIAGEDINISQFPGAICNTGCPIVVQNKVQDISQMYNSANCAGTATYLFQRQRNHGCDFYGTASVNEALARIANKYYVNQQECINYIVTNPTNPPTDPNNPCNIRHEISPGNEIDYTLHLTGNPRKMEVSAMTGPWGGLLDIGPPSTCSYGTCEFWNPSHFTHNDGRNIDLAFGALSPYQESGHSDDAVKLLRHIIKNDPLFLAFAASNEGIDMSKCATVTCNHYHAIFADIPSSTPKKTAALSTNSIPTLGAGKTLTISGILKDAITGAGISGKTITFISTTGTTAVPPPTTTGADGTFKTTATTVTTGGRYTAQVQFSGDSSYDKTSTVKNYFVDTMKPTASVTSPANGAIVTAGSSLTIRATAADKLLSTSTTNDGKIKQVSFFYKHGSDTTFTLIGIDTTSPYSTIWNVPNTAGGSYSLTARATDQVDNSQNSALIGITIPTKPVLRINTIPPSGPNKPITISGTLMDSVTNNGIAGKSITFTGTTGTIAVPPSVTTSSTGTFTTTATTVSTEGQFAARAQFAGDTSYSKTSASRIYYVDITKPTVSVTSPANGAIVAAGSSLTITANAADKLLSTSTTNDGKINQVSFYYKPSSSTTFTLIGIGSTSPYSITWNTPTTPGSYNLMARATDAAGNALNSVAIGVTVR